MQNTLNSFGRKSDSGHCGNFMRPKTMAVVEPEDVPVPASFWTCDRIDRLFYFLYLYAFFHNIGTPVHIQTTIVVKLFKVHGQLRAALRRTERAEIVVNHVCGDGLQEAENGIFGPEFKLPEQRELLGA
jgi:hypothetical protein